MGATTPEEIRKLLNARAKNKKRDIFRFSTPWMLFKAGFGTLAGVAAIFVFGSPVARHLPLSSEHYGLVSAFREKFTNAQSVFSSLVIPEKIVGRKVDSDGLELLKSAPVGIGHPEVAETEKIKPEFDSVDSCHVDISPPDIHTAKLVEEESKGTSTSHTAEYSFLVPQDFTAPDIFETKPLDSTSSTVIEQQLTPVAADFSAPDVSVVIPFDMTNRCALGEVCKPSQIRPLLSDGTMSRTVWDKPRALMKSNFAHGSAKVTYIWDEPLVVYFDNVLDESELDFIVETATPRFSKSLVAGPGGVPIPDQSRTSDTAWIYTSENENVRKILTKVTGLAGFSVGNAEDIGVNRYRKSQFFKAHHDYMQEHQLAAYSDFKNCQRAATALIYLSDVDEGGHSMFMRDEGNNLEYNPANPDHLAVEPKRGRVLVWYNMHPYTERVDDRTLHAGSPVKKGTKIAATVFIRNCTRMPHD